MPTTDTAEKGLETLTCRAMTGLPDHPDAPSALRDPGAPYGGTGWVIGQLDVRAAATLPDEPMESEEAEEDLDAEEES